MRHLRSMALPRLIAGLSLGLLLAITAVPLVAQPATETHAERGFGPVYDAAHEITLNGTIQTVVTKHTKGTAAGMHLMVMSEGVMTDAHVGSFLSRETKAALLQGAPVRMVGAMATLHAKSYLLVRELTIDNRTVTVRSKNGVLAPMPTARRVRTKGEMKSPAEAKEGAR